MKTTSSTEAMPAQAPTLSLLRWAAVGMTISTSMILALVLGTLA